MEVPVLMETTASLARVPQDSWVTPVSVSRPGRLPMATSVARLQTVRTAEASAWKECALSATLELPIKCSRLV